YILRNKTSENYQLLIRSLTHRAGVAVHPIHVKTDSPTTEITSLSPAKKLRQDYAFLSEPGTPPELKVLVSNKITAYHAYKASHVKLFDCTTVDDELNTVRNLVENYIENHAIHQELSFYQKTRKILG